MTESIVYVYAKDGKINVLSYAKDIDKHDKLIKKGWQHTATLNACMFIQYLHNKCEDIEKAVKELGIKKSE